MAHSTHASHTNESDPLLPAPPAVAVTSAKGKGTWSFARLRLWGSLGVLTLSLLAALCAPWLELGLGTSSVQQNLETRYLAPMSTVTQSKAGREARVEAFLAADASRGPELARALVELGIVEPSVSADEAPFVALDALDADPNPDSNSSLLGRLKEPTAAPLVQEFAKVVADGGPGVVHLLGTDELGRDVFLRLAYGGRVSLLVSLLVGCLAAFVGFGIGVAAGFYGGILDACLMRVTDAMLTIPQLPLLIVLSALDWKKLPGLAPLVGGEWGSVFKITIILSLFSWMTIARIVRGAVLSLRDNEFIVAARSMGASNLRIIIVHLFPHILGPFLVAVTLLMGDVLLSEAGLSFLGLGIQPPLPSWGGMLQNALEALSLAPHLALIPGALVFAINLAINFLGDALRDRFDPRLFTKKEGH